MDDRDLRRKKTICLSMIWIIAIFIPIYWWREPARQEAAIARIQREATTKGAEIYLSHCVSCHGRNGDNIAGKHLRRTLMDESLLVKVISRGRSGTGMPAFSNEEGGSLKKFEVNDVIAFIRNWDQSVLTSAAAHLPPKAEPSSGPALPAATAASKSASPAASKGDAQQGQSVYSNMGCGGCHGDKGQGDSAPSLRDKNSATIKKVVRSGQGAMPAFDAASLSDADLERIIAFLVQKK